MNQIISILQLKFKSIYNKAFRSTGQRKFKSLAIMLFVGIYLVQLHLAIKSFFNIFESFSSLGPLGAANLLSIVFTGLFLFMLFTSFFSGIPMMFKASDTNFLIVHNIGEREIFSTKYILAIFQVIWIPLIAATPLITAYGAYFSATPIFYPLSILSMALMLLIAASLGIIISLILARIFKPILLKHLLFTIGVCLAILMVLAFKKINPSALASPGAPNRIAMNFIERISSSTFSLRPDFWTADGIINLGYRRNLDFISRFSLMLSSFILIFILAMTFVSKYIFAPIMLKYSEMNKVNKLSKHPKLCKKNIIFWIWQNELHNFLEDLAYWPQSVILIAVFFIFTSISIGIIEVYPSMHGSMFLASNLFSGILIVLIAGRYVYTSVSQESGSYWIMRSGPISLFGWMLRKFSIYFILFAGFGSASVIFYLKRLRADKIIIGVSLMNIIVLALFITSLGYLYGVIFIDFKENDVWLIASNTGGIIFLISGFLSVVIISISYILPLLIPGKTPEIGFLANITGIYILLVYIIFRYATELLRRKDLG